MEGLDIKPDGTYVDVTFGGGGHSRELLSRLGPDGRLVAFDQDEDALRNIVDDKRLLFVRSNFKFLLNFLEYHHINKVDGILADLGVSSHHFDDSERGFSFRFDAELDMRMNTRAKLTAAEVLNSYDEKALADMFYNFGELKNSRKIAAMVVKQRTTSPLHTTEELMTLLEPLFNRERQKKEITKVFQAIRIEVNHEMDALQRMLEQTTEALKPGGRLVILTYHSLEDRMVKNFMRAGKINGEVEVDFFGNRKSPFRLVNNKVIVPDDDEVARNPRSRSAKLRIAELIG
jgi:16S rRNA (cytosine1402-N4)-methyltransferase